MHIPTSASVFLYNRYLDFSYYFVGPNNAAIKIILIYSVHEYTNTFRNGVVGVQSFLICVQGLVA